MAPATPCMLTVTHLKGNHIWSSSTLAFENEWSHSELRTPPEFYSSLIHYSLNNSLGILDGRASVGIPGPGVSAIHCQQLYLCCLSGLGRNVHRAVAFLLWSKQHSYRTWQYHRGRFFLCLFPICGTTFIQDITTSSWAFPPSVHASYVVQTCYFSLLPNRVTQANTSDAVNAEHNWEKHQIYMLLCAQI